MAKVSNADAHAWYAKEKPSCASVVVGFCTNFGLPVVECDGKSLLSKLKFNKDKIGLLKKKRRDAELAEYLAKEFLLPNRQQVTEVDRLLKVNKALSDDVERHVETIRNLKEERDMQTQCLRETANELHRQISERKISVGELAKCRQSYEEQLLRISELEEKNKSDSAKQVHHLHKSIRRKDEQVVKAKSSNKVLKEEVRRKSEQIIRLDKKLAKCHSSLKNTDVRANELARDKKKLQNKIHDLENKLLFLDAKSVVSLEKECSSLFSEVKDLRKKNDELEKLVEICESEEVVTFADGRYTDEVREVIMQLVSLNVSINKVNDVIQVVLETLAKKDVNNMRLPSDGCKKRILEEARILAQMQVAEAMLREEEGVVGNCLHGDGTSKYHRHYQNFQITTTDKKTLSLGLAEIAGGDASTVMESFTSMIDDLCLAISSPGEKEVCFAKLATSIKKTMSDQGPINPSFNAQLQLLREKVMPLAIDNWDGMESKKKDELKTMSHYFCKLHLLANFATEADKGLKEFEQLMLNDDFQSRYAFHTAKESGAFRLVRTACKAYHPRGCDKSGVAHHFNAFLEDQEKKSHLAAFVGNRFNIAFYNAAAVFFHKEDFCSFYDHWPDKNNLIEAVNEDLRNKLFFAEVRAMGIFDKIITGPLWRIIENVDSVLSMNSFLLQLKTALSQICENGLSIFHGQEIFDKTGLVYADELVKKDQVYDKLFEGCDDDEFETITVQALEFLAHAVLRVLERQASDHLPGGEHYKPPEKKRLQDSNVPAHNKASESDYAILDMLVRMKPRANIETLETITMWYRNDTMEWLQDKSEDEREQLMQDARKKVDAAKLRLKEKKKNLLIRKQEILRAKQLLKMEEDRKRALKQSEAVNTLISLGVKAWIEESEIESQLAGFKSEKEKLDVLYAQLEYYRCIILINKPCKREMFSKSKGGILLTVDEMADKLKNVIRFTISPQLETVKKSELKPLTERESLISAEKKKLKGKIFDVRLKNMMKQKLKELPRLIEKPNLLVGCKIKHKVRETKDEDAVWCNAEVLAVSDHIPKSAVKQKFEVRYEEDSEMETFSFPLLEDMEKYEMFVLSGLNDEQS